jgi:O-antigen ligase
VSIEAESMSSSPSSTAMSTIAKPVVTIQRLPARPLASFEGERFVRDFLFLATLLFCLFTVSPFPDLSDPELLTAKSGGDTLSQGVTILLTGALAAFAFVRRSPLLPRVVSLSLALTLVAFAISALLSPHSDVAGRHIVLAMFTLFQASMLLLLPYGREHFARLLALTAVVVLAACYFGVAFMPERSIHQLTDVAEPVLAGDWRGLFAHKNGAGAVMVMLIFIAIFIYRTWHRGAGIFIGVLAAVFLMFTHAKSPFNLLPVVLLVSYLMPRLRSSFLAFVLILGVPLFINLMTVGSVMFEPIKELDTRIMSDPTFTGRNEIWSFALDHVAQRPLFGFGFEAFWGMPDLVNAWNYLESWGYRASDAHNGYLNLAVTTGLVGLALSLCFIIVQPFRDFRRARALGADPALTALFRQIWIFALCLSGFEAELFRSGSALWFLTVSSIIGIRFLTLAESRE